ncbi:MAG: MBL fold metallo-hydrolase, partial [Chloroflexota bacterium]
MQPATRHRIGDFDLTIVSDGTFWLDGGAVMGLVPRVLWEPVVGKENIDAEHRIPLALNCMVLRRGADVLIVDTGFGNKLTGAMRERSYPGDYGHLLDNLAAIGIAPADVTAVANTHLHADHCGWNTTRGDDGVLRPTFANARYFVQAGEFETAQHPNERTRGTYFADNFLPLQQAGQLELVRNEHEIMPGVHFLP